MFSFRQYIFLGWLILSAASCGLADSVTNNTLVIGSPIVDVGASDAIFQQLLISEAYRRLGVEVELRHLPLKRCSHMANSGQVDGESERVRNYNEWHTNLVRVEAVTRTLKFVAYSVDPTLEFSGSGWDCLKGRSGLFCYQRGVKRLEEKLPEVLPAKALSEVNTVEQGLKKLVSGHSDVFVTFEYWMAAILDREEYRSLKGVVRSVAVLEEVPVYHFLHKKHAALAPVVAEVLKEMRAEGCIDEYLQTAYPYLRE